MKVMKFVVVQECSAGRVETYVVTANSFAEALQAINIDVTDGIIHVDMRLVLDEVDPAKEQAEQKADGQLSFDFDGFVSEVKEAAKDAGDKIKDIGQKIADTIKQEVDKWRDPDSWGK